MLSVTIDFAAVVCLFEGLTLMIEYRVRFAVSVNPEEKLCCC